MANSSRVNWEQRIVQYRAAKRGEGVGINYRPWLTIQDVPSHGLVSREKGLITGRVHHVMSNHELAYLHYLEWSTRVMDIREQFPLFEREDTMRIAESYGFKHSRYPGNKVNIVMTTDFLVTVTQPSGSSADYARTVKPARELQSRRTLEKLEIERRFWLEKETNWKIVTERDIPKTFADNVKAIRGYRDIRDRVDITEQRIQDIVLWLTEQVRTTTSPLLDIVNQGDNHFSVSTGTCVTVVLHLLANRRWTTDMNVPFKLKDPIILLNININTSLPA